MNGWIMLLGGGSLLYFGAEWFVGGASALALALRISQILVGLTVVAYGTSAPEIIVGFQAARTGHGDVALGNVIGSNIANLGLILGLAALISPPRVDRSLRTREVPVLLASTALLPLLLVNGIVSGLEGVALLAMAAAYTLWMVKVAHSTASVESARAEVATAASIADVAGAPRPQRANSARAAITAAVGLVVLLVGGHLFVAGAVDIAHSLGMSERLVGLTIVAIGTSLPELVTSVIAARRGQSDLAVGNVVGSNIFNMLLCLGAAATAGAITVPLATIALDIAGLLVMTTLGAIFLRSERVVSRREGALLLSLYVALLTITAVRG